MQLSATPGILVLVVELTAQVVLIGVIAFVGDAAAACTRRVYAWVLVAGKANVLFSFAACSFPLAPYSPNSASLDPSGLGDLAGTRLTSPPVKYSATLAIWLSLMLPAVPAMPEVKFPSVALED